MITTQKIKRYSLALLITLLAVANVQSQSSLIMVQQQHAGFQSDLLAYNKSMPKILNLVDSALLLKSIVEPPKPLSPLYDMTMEDWDDKWIETYNIASIPDTFKVDLTEAAIPLMGKVTSKYGWRWNRMHKGIDVDLVTGDPVKVAFDGKVSKTRYEARGYGYYVVVRHPNGLETIYAHLSKITVKPNQIVKAGDIIGKGGNTGKSTGSHLHFEVRFLGSTINPSELFDFESGIAANNFYEYRRPDPRKAGEILVHRIQSGDNLSKISNRYGISIAALCKLNNISSKKVLRIGEVLRVR